MSTSEEASFQKLLILEKRKWNQAESFAYRKGVSKSWFAWRVYLEMRQHEKELQSRTTRLQSKLPSVLAAMPSKETTKKSVPRRPNVHSSPPIPPPFIRHMQERDKERQVKKMERLQRQQEKKLKEAEAIKEKERKLLEQAAQQKMEERQKKQQEELAKSQRMAQYKSFMQLACEKEVYWSLRHAARKWCQVYKKKQRLMEKAQRVNNSFYWKRLRKRHQCIVNMIAHVIQCQSHMLLKKNSLNSWKEEHFFKGITYRKNPSILLNTASFFSISMESYTVEN
ncbi:hypothetical protein HMI55_004894 [Coelomomyces lativittatus]|nr:hypothetical protein HMI55_004894 [Coelomomyces lativittatus]